MRDIVWTIITIWFIYQVVNIFRSNSQIKKQSRKNNGEPEMIAKNSRTAGNSKSRLDHEGEYVDYEEIK